MYHLRMNLRALGFAALLALMGLCLGVLQSCGKANSPPISSGEPRPAARDGRPSPNPAAGLPPAEAFEPSDIPAPGTEKWTPSQAKALEVAAKVADAISRMKNTYGEAITLVKTPTGAGQVKLVYKVSDSRLYRVDYVVPSDVPWAGFVMADGERRREFDGKAVKDEPLSTSSPYAKLSDDDLVNRWPQEYSRIMFTGITDGQDSFRRFVEALAKGKGGFKLTIEERSLAKNGRAYRNYRLLAQRSQSAAKSLGGCAIEIVVDAERYLPVTVRVKSKDREGRSWDQQWSAGWGFNAKFTEEQVTSLQ